MTVHPDASIPPERRAAILRGLIQLEQESLVALHELRTACAAEGVVLRNPIRLVLTRHGLLPAMDTPVPWDVAHVVRDHVHGASLDDLHVHLLPWM